MAMSIIGTNTLVSIAGIPQSVPAKIDTGADGTALWASNIHLGDDGLLCYVLFDKQSPFYTGEKQYCSDFRIVKVTSSTGHDEFRFKVKLPITIKGKKLLVWCSLTNRSARKYPMLIGKRTLKGNFLVDVSAYEVAPRQKATSPRYTKEFHKNPHAFIEKYKKDLIIKDEA